MITYGYKMNGRTENAKVKKKSGVCVCVCLWMKT